MRSLSPRGHKFDSRCVCWRASEDALIGTLPLDRDQAKPEWAVDVTKGNLGEVRDAEFAHGT